MTMRSALSQLRTFGACPRRRAYPALGITAAAAALATTLIAALALPGTALATQSSAVSSNWSGYAVTNATPAVSFHRVAGSWTLPTASCEAGQETYSVAWVGLGGFRHGAKALEQAGTAANCTQSGRAVYYAWYELIPAAPVALRLSVHPGDAIAASVAQRGAKTILQVRDLTAHAARTRVRTVSPLDLTSAEWIVEAPSICVASSRCDPLPLTDFGTVAFTHASVSTGARARMPIDAPPLNVTMLEMRDYSQGRPGQQAEQAAATPATGVASALSAAGDAFTVTWQALSGQGSQAPGAAPAGLTSAAASIQR